MKRYFGAVCGMMLATMLVAEAQLKTINVVGFQKVTLERGKIYLLANAFEDVDGQGLTSADVFGSQVPNGTQVFAYDGVTPYVIDTKTAAGWSGSIAYQPSMGFWVKIPATAAQASYDVVLKGSAPMAPSTSTVLASGLNMLGYPYAANVPFSGTALYGQAGTGDRLVTFDAASQSYGQGGSTRTVAGWPAGAGNHVLKMGDGFWFYNQNASPVVSTEVRPYPAN